MRPNVLTALALTLAACGSQDTARDADACGAAGCLDAACLGDDAACAAADAGCDTPACRPDACASDAAHCVEDASVCDLDTASCAEDAGVCDLDTASCAEDAGACQLDPASCADDAGACHLDPASCASDAAPCGAGGAGCDAGVDTDASPGLAPQNAWGPAARLASIDVPADPPAARSAGCAVFGRNVGSGLNNLVLLAGGINRYVRPDARGRIQVVLLLQAAGWPEGARVEDVARVDLAFLGGGQDAEGRFVVDPGSLDAEGAPRSLFAGTRIEAGGWLEPPPGTFLLPVPTPGGFVLTLPLTEARVTGRAFVDGPGFGIADGVITGYVADATVLEEVARVRALCDGEAPPPICALVRGAIAGQSDEAVRDLLVGQAGGFDAHLDEAGHPYPCDPETGPPCNAISACLKFAAEGVVIAGIAAP